MRDFERNMSVLNWHRKRLKDADLPIKLYDVRNDPQYKDLDLSWNFLTSLPDLRTFRQFDSLKLLDLMCNKIIYIDFSLIPPTVTRLGLNFNKLRQVGSLTHCKKLEHLDASSNQVTEVDWRNLPPALIWLDLGNNQLTTVGDVSRCTRLSTLYVYKNHINHIDRRNLPSAMSRLDLSNNQLTTVDLSGCTELEVLDLSENPTLHSIQSLPNTRLERFDISLSVKVLGRKCFHENTFRMLQVKFALLKLEQPPVELLKQGLEAVLEYYTEKSIRTTHTR